MRAGALHAAEVTAKRVLNDPLASKAQKSVAAHALTCINSISCRDGKADESARRVLQDPLATKEEKSIAASVLVHGRKRRMAWINRFTR